MIGLGGISYGQVTTSIYLKVSVSDFLTLFSARAGEKWFWTSRPAPVLLIAGALALATSTLLACIWPLSRPDGIPTLGLLRRGNNHILPLYIWIYCIVWWFIQVRKNFIHYPIFDSLIYTLINFFIIYSLLNFIYHTGCGQSVHI